jgi:hypothetical protein
VKLEPRTKLPRLKLLLSGLWANITKNHVNVELAEKNAKSGPAINTWVNILEIIKNNQAMDSVDNDDMKTDLDIKAQPDSQGGSAEYRSASTPSASMSKTVTLTPRSLRAVYTSTAASRAVASPATVKAATLASTKAAEPTATATPVVAEAVATPARGRC